jgi:hypothetical protein
MELSVRHANAVPKFYVLVSRLRYGTQTAGADADRSTAGPPLRYRVYVPQRHNTTAHAYNNRTGTSKEHMPMILQRLAPGY